MTQEIIHVGINIKPVKKFILALQWDQTKNATILLTLVGGAQIFGKGGKLYDNIGDENVMGGI